MSIFSALVGDFDEDPFFGSQSRAMNQMVNSFFSDPFGDVMGMGMPGMGFPRLMGGPAMHQLMPSRPHQRGNDLMPFGFPNMGIFPTLSRQMQGMGDCHSFSSSTMVSMTTGPDGRPQVYQASSSTRTAPGGIRETKKAVADTRSGTKKMAVGHHIGERGHIIEREQNLYSGELEERQELINLEEDDTPTFNREWETRTRRNVGGISIEDVTDRPCEYNGRPLLALPSSNSTGSARSRTHRAPITSSSCSAAVASSNNERPRKRDHGPDGQSSRRASKQQRGRRE